MLTFKLTKVQFPGSRMSIGAVVFLQIGFSYDFASLLIDFINWLMLFFDFASITITYDLSACQLAWLSITSLLLHAVYRIYTVTYINTLSFSLQRAQVRFPKLQDGQKFAEARLPTKVCEYRWTLIDW